MIPPLVCCDAFSTTDCSRWRPLIVIAGPSSGTTWHDPRIRQSMRRTRDDPARSRRGCPGRPSLPGVTVRGPGPGLEPEDDPRTGAVRFSRGMTSRRSGSMAGFGSPVRSRDINRAVTSCSHDIFGWSMRSWESASPPRPLRGTDPQGRMDHPIGTDYRPMVAERLTGQHRVKPRRDNRRRVGERLLFVNSA